MREANMRELNFAIRCQGTGPKLVAAADGPESEAHLPADMQSRRVLSRLPECGANAVCRLGARLQLLAI